MAPRLIRTILYTLISVNLLALVLGGLVTWLSHSIPIRLRQFGLSPELTQVAGFCSLLIACLGLGALNFSSHYALKAYGFSCAVFVVFMLFGILPDKWLDSIKEEQQSSLHQQLLQANYTSTVSRRAPKSTPAPSRLVLNLIYGLLLVTFGTLVVFALVFAQYLRRHELEEQDEQKEHFKRSALRQADALCNRRSCTCDLQQASVPGSNILGSLPNLKQQTSEDSLVPKYSSLSHSDAQWVMPLAGRHPWLAQDNQHPGHTVSSRSLVSLGNGRESTDQQLGTTEQQQDDERATSSLRHQAKRISGAAPPPLVHRGFYYAANMKDGASSQASALTEDSLTRPQQSAGNANTSRVFNSWQARELADLSTYPQVSNSYRQSSRSLRSINIDNSRCHCGSSVASTLAAKLRQPSLALDFQHTNKRSSHKDASAHAGPKCEPYAWPRAAERDATNRAAKQRISKPSGASVMAMTAAAAAALFGGVVDVSPLDGAAGQGGADGMLESTLDECGDLMEDYALHYDAIPLASSNAFGHHQHHQMQSQHDARCDFDDADHELTGAQHAGQVNANLVYAPPWDYGPMMNELAQR